jgi:hypothetical protein
MASRNGKALDHRTIEDRFQTSRGKGKKVEKKIGKNVKETTAVMYVLRVYVLQ